VYGQTTDPEDFGVDSNENKTVLRSWFSRTQIKNGGLKSQHKNSNHAPCHKCVDQIIDLLEKWNVALIIDLPGVTTDQDSRRKMRVAHGHFGKPKGWSVDVARVGYTSRNKTKHNNHWCAFLAIFPPEIQIHAPN
jgi:hypothetical protein